MNKGVFMPAKEQTQKNLSMKYIAWGIMACIGIYFFVETIFPKQIPCNDKISQETCSCVQYSVSRNVSFFNKIRIMIVGASREELITYMDMGDLLRCAVISNK